MLMKIKMTLGMRIKVKLQGSRRLKLMRNLRANEETSSQSMIECVMAECGNYFESQTT